MRAAIPRNLLCGCHRFDLCPIAETLWATVTRTRAAALSGASDSFGSDAWDRYYAAMREYRRHVDVPAGAKEPA